MTDDTLVDQTQGRLSIETGLRVGLERFNEEPKARGMLLSSYAESMAKAVGRTTHPVKIYRGPGDNFDVRIRNRTIEIGSGYIEQIEKWRDSGVERAEAAVFGTVARLTARKTGTGTFNRAKEVIDTPLRGMFAGTKSGERIAEAAGNSIASYVSTAHGIREINEEFPGLRGAIAASFIANAQCTEPREMFTSEKDSERWRATWSTLIMETLTPDAVPDEVYPSEEVRDAVRQSAALLRDCVDDFGAVRYDRVKEAVDSLAPVFVREEDEEREEEGGGGGGEGPDEGKLDASLASDSEGASLPYAPEGKDTPVKGLGVPGVLETGISVKQSVAGDQVTASPLTESLRQWLVDVRLEQNAGQQAGRVSPQIHRLHTDGRIFAKRMRIPEAPDACVVIAVDGSGSMGFGAGSNMDKAIKLHDALAYALDQLEIEFASCVYAGDDAREEEVHPVNLPGDPFPKAVGTRAWRGGNGDMAAMLWSTKVLEESGKKMGAVVFLADGQFTTTNSAAFTAKAKELNVTTFHVDFINSATSPFGGGHIHAGGRTIEQIAEPLARGLAAALGLE